MRARLLLLGVLLAACSELGPPTACTANLPSLVIHVGDNAIVHPCFEAEALPLIYTVESSNPAAVATIEGYSVLVRAVGVGEAVITVIAKDNNGLTARQTARVSIPNRAPLLLNDREDILEISLWSERRLLLTNYISEPDYEPLRYRVSTADAKTIRAQVEGDTLIIRAELRGSVRVSVTASDPAGESVLWIALLKIGDPDFYITQGSHSRSMDVPLVAGRDGLLRVFLRSDLPGTLMPEATATLYNAADIAVSVTQLTSEAAYVPTVVEEGLIEQSLNAWIDGATVRPGVRLVIDVMPTADLSVLRRVDAPLDIRELADLRLRLLPIVIGRDSSAVGDVKRALMNPTESYMLHEVLYALPVHGYSLTGHEPIEFSGNNEIALLHTLQMAWTVEGRDGYYMGVIPKPVGGVAGLAYTPGWVGYSLASSCPFSVVGGAQRREGFGVSWGGKAV